MSGPIGPNSSPSPASAGALLVRATHPAADTPVLARRSVEEMGPAGVNRRPGARSTYRWSGADVAAEEPSPKVTTTIAGDPPCARRARGRHRCVLAPIPPPAAAAGFEPYLEWLKRSVTPA